MPAAQVTQMAPVSVIIPTWKRPQQLTKTLDKIYACSPPPSEILIHIDANDTETTETLTNVGYPALRIFIATTRQGPGGGRNLLAREAQQPLLASFDDDSYPMDPDYFSEAVRIMDAHPKAAVLTASVTWRDQVPIPTTSSIVPVRVFENCGCIMRRSVFLQSLGYLPLEQAYGMEEADLALQLLDQGHSILRCPQLRVFHDTTPHRHADPATNAAHIRNTALLAFLRYPLSYWPLGIAQTARRVVYSLKCGRYRGIISGLASIPQTCWKSRHLRKPVHGTTVRLSRSLA
jgi:GT2 family glycosyltransferase